MHYDEVAAEKHTKKSGTQGRGNVLNCVAFAHRKKLNQKLVLPNRVKEILRRPQDELIPAKLELLSNAVRQELEAETCVYLATSDEIEALASAVEGCKTECPDEVGPYASNVTEDRQKIHVGARLIIGVDKKLPLAEQRIKAAELVRSFVEGQAVYVKMRPLNTWRRPPLDTFARELMNEPHKSVQDLFGENMEEARDRLLLAPCLVTVMKGFAYQSYVTRLVAHSTRKQCVFLPLSARTCRGALGCAISICCRIMDQRPSFKHHRVRSS